MAVVQKVWTLFGDFNEGTFTNAHNELVAADESVIADTNAQPPLLPFICVPCSGRGTIVRIDANTGAILGEYSTAPNGLQTNPSRTSVDSAGNVWVGNRAEQGQVGGVPKGSVARIGLVVGGTRCNADGTPNPVGQFLKPPFQYSTAVDRDGDGLIRTSRGVGNVLAWPNITDGIGGADGIVQDAQDELIQLYQRTTAVSINQVNVDDVDDVWVGGYTSTGFFMPFNRLSAFDASFVTTTATPPAGGNGGAIDSLDHLWSCSFLEDLVLRLDTVTLATNTYSVLQPYALAIDSHDFVWVSMHTLGSIAKLSNAGVMQVGFPKCIFSGTYPACGTPGASQTLAITADDHVWVTSFGSTSVARLNNAGTLLKLIPLGANGVSQQGISVDTNGNVWVACGNTNRVFRINPTGGGDGLGAVDLEVNLGSGAGPFALNEMTGAVQPQTTQPSGVWNVIYDAGQAVNWQTISWHQTTPANTTVTVRWRAAVSLGGLSSAVYVTATNSAGSSMSPTIAQFVQVDVALDRDDALVLGAPSLQDLTIEGVVSGGGTVISTPTGIPGNIPGVNPREPALPNLLLVCPQGLGVEQLNRWATGSTYANTPFLDSLIDRGVRFTNAYAAPNAQGTLASLISGMWAFHSGVSNPPVPGQQPLLPGTASFTLALRELSASSSRFGYFGDFTIATHESLREAGPIAQGFDRFFGRIDAITEHDDWPLVEADIFGYRQGRVHKWELRVLCDECVAWLSQQPEIWTAVLAPRLVDFPLEAPPGSALAVDGSGVPLDYYIAQIESLDQELDRMHQAMPQALRANVLWVFWPLSTTPASLLVSPFDAAHGPGTVYQQGTNVPMFCAGSGVTLGGRSSADLISPTDLWRTLLDLTGATTQPASPAESISFRNALRSSTGHTTRTFVYSEVFSPNGINLGASAAGQRAIRNSQYKLVRVVTGTSFPNALDEFYDLLADPRETTNLIPGGATGGLTAPQLTAYNSLKALYIATVNTS